MIFPYNGRKIGLTDSETLNPEDTEPLWWPTNVRRREPDPLL